MFDLKGRTVVITGASSGLGKAAVYAYAKAGAAVLITARRFERLEAIREELAAQDYRVEAVACDVREEEQVRETVKHALRSFGKIDVLCSFAAVTDDRDVAELESGQWNDVLQTNLSGVYYFSKHVIPHMKERGYGRIINIGSVYGLVGSQDETTPWIQCFERRSSWTDDRHGGYIHEVWDHSQCHRTGAVSHGNDRSGI